MPCHTRNFTIAPCIKQIAIGTLIAIIAEALKFIYTRLTNNLLLIINFAILIGRALM
ncbi:hypothetical protein GPUN_2050 [Glaciecola punicea ACAM 611]|uniref:Uncharacterized protein n=1 Tax=Glaciecola punicea ACAM 611 TaxID=1121923 RepID=H5TCY8_9ALTE|nr:hypothetical protein GPUN_2050 [Glaciecola punicea ACAM 611]